MNERRMRAWLTSLFVVAAMSTAAQDASPPPAADGKAGASTANDETEGMEDTDQTVDATAKPPSSPDVFVPSEEISEDLAVTFPVDI